MRDDEGNKIMLYDAYGRPIAKSVDAYKMPKNARINPDVSDEIQYKIKSNTKFREKLELMARMSGKPCLHLVMSKHQLLASAMRASNEALYQNQKQAELARGQ